jgi:hypothetical protein
MRFDPAVVLALALSVGIGIRAEAVNSATVLSQDEASQLVVIRNLNIGERRITGELVNESLRTVRDVQLLIRHSWRWKSEFRPKDDSRDEAVYYTIDGEIPPGRAARFTYSPAHPLPSGPDGYFETTVSLAGFTQVIK